jgi:Dictyostelium (slime mold) repeat
VRRRAIVPLLLASSFLLAAVPEAAHAAKSCNGFIAISYDDARPFYNVGDRLRVVLTVGAGTIGGGTKIRLNRVRFELDCDSASPLGLGCPDDGDVIKYLGDDTIRTTCPKTFTTGHEAGTSPNELILTPSTPFYIPAGAAKFCTISFGIEVMNRSDDVSPGMAEEVAGYSAANGDVRCDNGLASEGTQSGSVILCPSCDDYDPCTTDTCDDAGLCHNTAPGTCTPCTSAEQCGDNNACTTDTCNGGVCDNSALIGCTPCTSAKQCGDGNACTTDTCDAGLCHSTAVGDCGPCTSAKQCGDGNACTTDTCDGGVCHNTALVGCSPCTSAEQCGDGNACTTDTCDGGVCHSTAVGDCGPCTTAEQCGDGNACTTDTCDASGCHSAAVIGCRPCTTAEECGDADACTTDTCDGGVCHNTAVSDCRPCTSAEQCGDGNACTTDTCDAGGCHSVAVAGCTPCTTAAACGDANPCTADTCDAGVCHNTAVGDCGPCTSAEQCGDGNACTTDTCDAGVCHGATVGGCTPCTTAEECGDANPCTADTCDAGICHNTTVGDCGPCTNGKQCGDANACTTDSCENGQCVHTPIVTGDCAGGPCGNGVVVTLAEAVAAGRVTLESRGCFSGDCVTLGVTNSDGSVGLGMRIAIGEVFINRRYSAQNMIELRADEICIPPGETIERVLAVACVDAKKGVPKAGDRFGLGPPLASWVGRFGAAAELSRLLAVIDQRKAWLEPYVARLLWLVTDGTPLPDTAALLLSLVETAGIDPLSPAGDFPHLSDPLAASGDPVSRLALPPEFGVDAQCLFGLPDGSCDDGDPCTTGDACRGTSCVSGAAVDPAISCDDAEACTIDTCDKGVGCRHEPQSATRAESVTCGVENLRAILAGPPSPGCSRKCFTKLDHLFGRVRTLISAATGAPARRCRRKLDVALRVAAKLRRTIRRLAAKGQISAPPERAVALAGEAVRLGGRISALRDSCAGR